MKGLWLGLQQALGCEYVFHFTGTDAKSERAECAVRRSVAVSAHDGRPGPSQSQFWSDDVNDALIRAIQPGELDTKVAAISLESINLRLGDRINDRQRAVCSGNVVIGSSECKIRATNLPSCKTKSLESLRRSHFVNQVTIDVKNCRLVGLLNDDMSVPDFFEQGFRHSASAQEC
jgi:hypothetical protein